MNEYEELNREIQALHEIPAWEWEPEYDEVLERLARRKLEILHMEGEA